MNPIDADLCPKCGDSLAKHSYFTQQAGVLFMCPPTLELPTEPTWGILLRQGRQPSMGRWHFFGQEDTTGWTDFIPLTAEQVRRIEAAP